MDRLVALGRDADAPPIGQQMDDDPRAGPRLAGAGRPLQEEVAPVQPEGERLHLREIRGLDRGAGGAAVDARELAREDGLERPVAVIAGVNRFAHAQDGRALGPGLDRAARDDRLGQTARTDLRAP